MPYKMILNILILFLCTSCCSWVNCSDNIDTFYLEILENGENIIGKYAIKDTNSPNRGKIYLTTKEDKYFYTYFSVEGDKLGFSTIGDEYMAEGAEYKLWISDKVLGDIFIKTKFMNEKGCCSSRKIEVVESRTDSVSIVEKM